MSQHYGITSTYGVTLPSGAIAQDASKSQSVDLSEVVGEDGEYALANPLLTKKTEVTINGVGPAGLDVVASASSIVPGTMTVTKADQNESNKGRSTFTLSAAAYAAFADSAGDGSTDADGDPDETTLNIVSVAYSLAESVKVSTEVMDLVLTGADGGPAARGALKLMSKFDVKGRGDLPVDIALGTGNIGIAALTSGTNLVNKLDEDQKMDDWNGWAAAGNSYPALAA